VAEMFYDDDADLSVIQGRKVAVIGYGSQGHAHALNLRDSGVDVRVGLAEGSKSRAKAEAEGLRVVSVATAVQESDLVMILTPDQVQRTVYAESIAPNLKQGSALFFAHGFNIRFGYIKAPSGVDIAMVAPKGPGHLVRREDRLSRTAETVVGRGHADDVRVSVEQVLEDRAALDVVPVRNGLVGSHGVAGRLDRRVVALVEQRRVVVGRGPVQLDDCTGLVTLSPHALDEALADGGADRDVVEGHVVGSAAAQREPVVVDGRDTGCLGLGLRARRLVGVVEETERERTRAGIGRTSAATKASALRRRERTRKWPVSWRREKSSLCDVL